MNVKTVVACQSSMFGRLEATLVDDSVEAAIARLKRDDPIWNECTVMSVSQTEEARTRHLGNAIIVYPYDDEEAENTCPGVMQ